MEKTKEEFISCDCGCKILRLWEDDETGEVYLSTYESMGNRAPWIHRLRMIWKILTTGTPYEDEICLNKESQEKLKTFFNKG